MLCLQRCIIPLRHSAISLLLTQWEIIILLSPTAIRQRLWLTTSFLSLFSNKTFAMIVAMQILHRHLAALFHFNPAYLFWRPLFLTPKCTELPTTGRTPNASSSLFNCFLPTTTTSTKNYLSTQAFLKLLNWKPSIFLFDSFFFTLNITERVTKSPSSL